LGLKDEQKSSVVLSRGEKFFGKKVFLKVCILIFETYYNVCDIIARNFLKIFVLA